MGKRFAIVIGVAAAGAIALGAQTATSSTGGPVDTIPPDLQLSGPKRQDPQNDPSFCDRFFCDVEIKVSCGDEECTAHLKKGKLTKVKEDTLRPFCCDVIPPGKTRKEAWELNPSQRKQVREALDDGKNVQAKVTVKATDAAGNVATAKRTIRLVKSVPG